MYSGLRSEARKGRMLPYVIEVDGSFGGQLTIGNVTHGALRSAWIGYWVASEFTGGGVATGALAVLLMAPWFLTAPQDFFHDTVTLLVSFHAILFANTLYLLALNVFGVTLPFWITGLVVLGTLVLVMVVVHRRQPDIGELVRWLALLLLVANLVNKQAFYNQFWLAGALVVVSLAVPPTGRPVRTEPPVPAGVVRPLT